MGVGRQGVKWMLVGLAASLAASAPSAAPSVDHVMAKLDDLYRSKASVARLELIVVSARSTRTLRVRRWTLGEDRARAVVEEPPREAGIETLRVDDNVWTRLPKVARTVTVTPAMLQSSWMGTDFTTDDLVFATSLRHDYESRLEGWTTAPEGWRIVSAAKPGLAARWPRIETIVTPDFLPIEMRSFDRQGRLARTLTFDEVEVVSGRQVPTHLVLVPAAAGAQRTELRYLELQLDADVPDDTFSLSAGQPGS